MDTIYSPIRIEVETSNESLKRRIQFSNTLCVLFSFFLGIFGFLFIFFEVPFSSANCFILALTTPIFIYLNRKGFHIIGRLGTILWPILGGVGVHAIAPPEARLEIAYLAALSAPFLLFRWNEKKYLFVCFFCIFMVFLFESHPEFPRIQTGLSSQNIAFLRGSLEASVFFILIFTLRHFTQKNLESERALSLTVLDLSLEDERRKKKEQELEHFSYTTSHDLQEPLRTVTSYLQLLLKRHSGFLDTQAKELVLQCVESAKKMKALIQSLLQYSRVSKQYAQKSEIDLNSLFLEVTHNLSILIGETAAKIESPKLPMVLGDSKQLQILFYSILENSLKYRGSQNPEIQISFSQESHFCKFFIQDNGVGIPNENLAFVFDLFNRGALSKTDSTPGSGIGLSVSKKIVENHEGQIGISSKEGKGTTVWFTLPQA